MASPTDITNFAHKQANSVQAAPTYFQVISKITEQFAAGVEFKDGALVRVWRSNFGMDAEVANISDFTRTLFVMITNAEAESGEKVKLTLNKNEEAEGSTKELVYSISNYRIGVGVMELLLTKKGKDYAQREVVSMVTEEWVVKE